MSNPFDNVNITSFYDAYRQGKQDKRADRINAMQDELLISQKQMADEQARFKTAYNIVDALERVPEVERDRIYRQAVPTLQRLFPEYDFPPQYSPEWNGQLGALKTYFSSGIGTQYEKAGDNLYQIRGDDVKQVGGGDDAGKGFSVKAYTYANPDGSQYTVDIPEQKDIFGNIHRGDRVFVRGASSGVSLQAYEAWLKQNVSPEQFEQYRQTRVDIPSGAVEQQSGRRVPTPVPNSGNTAGRTNQGFAISEDEIRQPPVQQGAPKPAPPTRDYLNPDGSLKKRSSTMPQPEIDYSGSEPPPVAMQPQSAPQGQPMPFMGANALLGDSGGGQGMNRFATLQPFGSEPVNRLAGSQGIEGIEQAYTDGARMTGAPRQGAQPQKVTKEDLLIRAGRGDRQAEEQLRRMAEIERSTKGQKVPDKVFGAYQQSMADMESIRYTLSEMRKYRAMIQKGDINLNPMSQFAGSVLSPFDLQSDTFDNSQNFKRSLIAQANALLQENKGVQTDGDAKRAMGELASGTTNFGNKEMKSALDVNIRNLNRVYTTLQRQINDYKKRYPAIGEL